jgi:decaprenyl-phosphate phosphoribosyltransferase
MSLGKALLKTARPKQWAKNVLVFAAPAAAGVITHRTALFHSLVAFVAFCLTASGTYYLNDAFDVDADRNHPKKRFRPIAAGALSAGRAKIIGVGLIVIGVGISIPINHGKLAGIVGGYAALTFCYSAWLKHEPVIDLGALAAGFVLRAIAGGVAAPVAISNWFLIVTGAGAMFIVIGKRRSEVTTLDGTDHRSVLEHYPLSFLDSARAATMAVAITAYCIWAFEKAAVHVHAASDLWYRLSIVPFVLAILRYSLVIDQDRGGAPEDVILGDRMIILLGALWILFFMMGVKGV